MTVNKSSDLGSSSNDGESHQTNNEIMTEEKSLPREQNLNPQQPGEVGYSFEDVVSGQFDADEESPEVLPAKRVLAPMAETPKLHKVLAQAGMGSRLEMEQLILEGRITVNNEPAHIG